MSIISEVQTIDLSEASVFVRECGPENARPILFLHGWPQDGSAWDRVASLASGSYRCLSIDLPGIGRSSLASPNGDSSFLADILRDLVTTMRLTDLTIVGHDVGGMIAFSYVREYHDLRGAVIMDTVIPGVSPWEAVLANPYLWHFAFHSIPDLPELLVGHHIRAYFDFFFDAIAADSGAITEQARERYVRSYSHPHALTQGFEFYRALGAGARRNAAESTPIGTPVLYLRGEREGGALSDYEAGLRAAGVEHLTSATIPGSGHFAPEEAPGEVFAEIQRHVERLSPGSNP